MNTLYRKVVFAPPDDVFRVTPEDHPKPHNDEEDAIQREEAARKARWAREDKEAAEAREAARQESEELSHRILRTANAEAEKITRAAQEKAEAMRTAAQQEGYNTALSQKSEQIAQRLTRVDQILKEMSERQQRFFADYNRELEELSLSVAEKIMAHKIEMDPKEMADLLLQAVGSVRTDDWITIEVSEELPGLVQFLQEDYAEYLEKRQIELSAVEAPKGTCVVQTSTGVTDASIATQLGNLRELMRMQNPDASS